MNPADSHFWNHSFESISAQCVGFINGLYITVGVLTDFQIIVFLQLLNVSGFRLAGTMASKISVTVERDVNSYLLLQLPPHYSCKITHFNYYMKPNSFCSHCFITGWRGHAVVVIFSYPMFNVLGSNTSPT